MSIEIIFILKANNKRPNGEFKTGITLEGIGTKISDAAYTAGYALQWPGFGHFKQNSYKISAFNIKDSAGH